MELQTPKSDVIISEGQEVVDCSIKIDAATFKIFSETLYSRTYDAIVRELACNAYDSQTVAGTLDRPFEINLPTALASTFSIRDFGTGMSKETMKRVFSQWFNSTKREDNTQTGCFGIGSKAPLAYVPKFTVVSWHGGIKHIMQMALQDDGDGRGGVPAQVFLSETPSDEPSGLEVYFHVQPENYYDFRVAAETVLRPFPEGSYKVVRGGSHFDVEEYPERDFLSGEVTSPSMGKFPYKVYYSNSGFRSTLVMGNVEYPLVNQNKFSLNAKRVANLSIKIDCPLNTFSMTPSRETVQWSEDFSIPRVNEVLELIFEQIDERLDNEVAAADSYWEACLLAKAYFHKSPFSQWGHKPQWKGKKIQFKISVESDLKDGDVTMTGVQATTKRGDTLANNSASEYGKVRDVDVVGSTRFFINDLPGKKGLSRIKKHIRYRMAMDQVCYLISSEDKKKLDALTKETLGLHTTKIEPVSSLEDFTPPRRAGGGGGGGGGSSSAVSGTRCLAYTPINEGHYSRRAADKWEPSDIDLEEDSGVFVEISRWKVCDSMTGESISDIRDILRDVCKVAGIDQPILVGVRTAQVQKFHDSDSWHSFDAWARDILKDAWMNDTLLRWSVDFHTRSSFYQTSSWGDSVVSSRHRDAVKTFCARVNKSRNLFSGTPWVLHYVDKIKDIISKKADEQATRFVTSYLNLKLHEEFGLVSPNYGGKIQYYGVLADRIPLLQEFCTYSGLSLSGQDLAMLVEMSSLYLAKKEAEKQARDAAAQAADGDDDPNTLRAVG